MNLRHIEVFHAIYTAGSVSAAARVLNVSQPSVTKVLRHAEQLLGFPLFERSKGRLIPTEDAHALFRNAAEIQERVYQFRQASQNMRRGRGARLRISTLPSLALEVFPKAVAAFLTQNRDVSFELHTVH